MDADLFNENAPGRLVKISTARGPDWAFVPDPLPPKIDAAPRLYEASEAAVYALGELNGLGRRIGNPWLFIRPLIKREARLGSIIEGTVVDLKDLFIYEEGRLRFPGTALTPEVAAIKEVGNYVNAIEYAFEQKELPLSLRLIKKSHEILMANVRGGEAEPGRFRVQHAGVGAGVLKEARYIAPPVPEMEGCLDALEKYLQSDDDNRPLLRIAFAHYQFEAIHPFRDGNGRIGRLLIHLLFDHWRLLDKPLLYLSRFFEKNKGEYNTLLFNVTTRGAWTEWLIFFLEAVRTEAEDTAARIMALEDLRRKWRGMLSQASVTTKVSELADKLIENPVLGYQKAADLISEDVAKSRYYVKRLVDLGILTKINGGAYRKRFVCEPVLDILIS
jgi:Fic family protein